MDWPHVVICFWWQCFLSAGDSDTEKGDSTCKDTEDDEADMDNEAGECGG